MHKKGEGKLKKKKTSENYLDLIPGRRETLDWETDAEDKITLLQENKGIFHTIARKIFHRPRISRIHLDEMGNYIWPLLDGKRDVYEIGQLVKKRFGDKAEPLYERLITYLELLKEYGFIELRTKG